MAAGFGHRIAHVVDDVGVVAGTADQAVGAGAAVEIVVAVQAPEHVGQAVAAQVIGVGRAGEVLDADELIALGVAALADREQALEHDDDAGRRLLIGRRVVAGTAVEKVGAGAAGERVVAVAAVKLVSAAEALEDVVVVQATQHVVAVVADEAIVMVRAGHVLDADEHVALRGAVKSLSRCQVDDHSDERIAVGRRVSAGAPVDIVGTTSSFDLVVAAEPENRVVALEAEDHVGAAGDAVACIDRLGTIRSINVRHGPALSRLEAACDSGAWSAKASPRRRDMDGWVGSACCF